MTACAQQSLIDWGSKRVANPLLLAKSSFVGPLHFRYSLGGLVGVYSRSKDQIYFQQSSNVTPDSLSPLVISPFAW